MIVAAYLLYGYGLINKNPRMKESINKSFALVIGIIGAITLLTTFIHFLTEWAGFPASQYTELFGITLAIFSILMLAGSFTLYTGADFRPVSYLAALGGLWMFQAVNAVLSFNLTRSPLVTAALYTFAGFAGLSFLPATHIPETHRAFRWARIAAAALIIGMSLIALFLGLNAMYGHIERFVS
jgi:putative membrane protein